MKRNICIVFFISIFYTLSAQGIIEWQPDYKLQLSDFKSQATQIGNGNTFNLSTPATVNFSFSMSTYEFMFTKNFNSKVNCTFNRDAATLVAPNDSIAQRLIRYAQFEFDLNELFARNFRQQLYKKKGTFSNAKFFQPIYDSLHQQFTLRDADAGKQTSYGENMAKLEELDAEVLKEINDLSDFCKTCKPKRNNQKQ
jgi:hypothetical protein